LGFFGSDGAQLQEQLKPPVAHSTHDAKSQHVVIMLDRDNQAQS